VKTTFTPGPYHSRINIYCTGGYIFSKDHRLLAYVTERYAGVSQSEMDANCHLISSAPELYAALSDIVQASTEHSPLLAAAYAALEKADGKETT